MLNALESCAHLFTRLGGHAHAAGFALPGERIPELRAALEKCARECLSPEDLEPKLRYDTELCLDEITAEFWAQLRRMEPFGAGNPEPVFVARRLCLLAPPRIVTDKHLKLRLRQPVTPAPDAVPAGRIRRCSALSMLSAGGWRTESRPNRCCLRMRSTLLLPSSRTCIPTSAAWSFASAILRNPANKVAFRPKSLTAKDAEDYRRRR